MKNPADWFLKNLVCYIFSNLSGFVTGQAFFRKENQFDIIIDTHSAKCRKKNSY